MYWRPIDGESVHGLYTLPRPLKAENAEGFRFPDSSSVVDVSERMGRLSLRDRQQRTRNSTNRQVESLFLVDEHDAGLRYGVDYRTLRQAIALAVTFHVD